MAMNQPTNDERHLAPVESSAPAHIDMFSDARIKLIRDTVAAGAPEEVFAAMIEIARTRNLDPMAKQISVMQFKKNGDWSIMTTIDGYRAIAGDHPDFAGKDRPEYGPVLGKTPTFNRDYPEWCSVTVYRMVHGQRMPFTAEVWWEEYYGGNFTWNKMPRTMLAKVAESHALRMAFSRSLSGVYTREEMDQAAIDVPSRMVSQTTGEIHDVRQSRQDAPQRAEQAQPASVEVEPPKVGTWEDENRRLHGIANSYGIDHRKLKVWLIAAALQNKQNPRRITSTKEVSAEALRFLADRIEHDAGQRVEKEATEALMSPDVYELYEQGEAEKAMGTQEALDIEPEGEPA